MWVVRFTLWQAVSPKPVRILTLGLSCRRLCEAWAMVSQLLVTLFTVLPLRTSLTFFLVFLEKQESRVRDYLAYLK